MAGYTRMAMTTTLSQYQMRRGMKYFTESLRNSTQDSAEMKSFHGYQMTNSNKITVSFSILILLNFLTPAVEVYVYKNGLRITPPPPRPV